MNYPLPVRLLQIAVLRLKRPALTLGLSGLLVLLALFYLTSSLFPPPTTEIFTNQLEGTGIFLLLSTLPPYLLACTVIGVRATPRLRDSLSRLLDAGNQSIADRLDRVGWWPLGIALGLLNAVLANINWGALTFTPGHPDFVMSLNLVMGQKRPSWHVSKISLQTLPKISIQPRYSI